MVHPDHNILCVCYAENMILCITHAVGFYENYKEITTFKVSSQLFVEPQNIFICKRIFVVHTIYAAVKDGFHIKSFPGTLPIQTVEKCSV